MFKSLLLKFAIMAVGIRYMLFYCGPFIQTNKTNQMKLHSMSLTMRLIRIITSHYAARNCQNSKMICRVATCFWREHYAKHDYGVLHVDNG